MRCLGNYVVYGQAKEDRDHKQWLVGPFMPTGNPLNDPHTEVKFADHKKGEGRPESQASASDTHHSMSILFRGKLTLHFWQNDQWVPVTLQEPGEYALWQRGALHWWQADEDTTLITIRWLAQPPT